MAKKLIFQTLDKQNNVITKKLYKSLRDIHNDFPQFSYHQLRQIYLQSTNLEPKNMHQSNKILFQQIRIIDSPDVFNKINDLELIAIGL